MVRLPKKVSQFGSLKENNRKKYSQENLWTPKFGFQTKDLRDGNGLTRRFYAKTIAGQAFRDAKHRRECFELQSLNRTSLPDPSRGELKISTILGFRNGIGALKVCKITKRLFDRLLISRTWIRNGKQMKDRET